MASPQGPNNPGTMADDSSVGTAAWSNPDNAIASDNAYAIADLNKDTTTVLVWYEWKLIIDGSVAGTSQSVGNSLTASDAYRAYGSSTNLWGTTPTPSQVNSSDFGVRIMTNAGTTKSHGLRATNFGFSIPTGATIVGVVAAVENHWAVNPTNRSAFVDHIRITVYYTEAGSGPAALQTVNGLAKASVATRNGLAIASIKTWDGLA